ncbi:MaoC/PaaZ C-terminal domain-containing protein [Chloroflexota bacterium]
MVSDMLYWEDVAEGSEISPISLELTMKRMIMAVCATRDYYPVHHDRDFARNSGHKDIFVNQMFLQGFLGRCLTDWTGPEGRLRKLSIEMIVPNYLGDTITANGRVTRKYLIDGELRVDCDLIVTKQDGTATVNSQATIALPSKKRLIKV